MAPRWLNLHGVVDEELCRELGELADEAEALERTVEQFAIRAYRAAARFDVATSTDDGPPMEVYEALRRSSGLARLSDALLRLGSQLDAVHGESLHWEPPWVQLERTRAGVSWPTLRERDR